MQSSQTNHLTKDQITAYHNLSERDTEKREIGRHLLICDDCRSLLPLPTREQFLRAVFGDEDDENDLDEN